jgi:hypothetical protein
MDRSRPYTIDVKMVVLLFASYVTLSNPDSLSSMKTMIIYRKKKLKNHFSE